MFQLHFLLLGLPYTLLFFTFTFIGYKKKRFKIEKPLDVVFFILLMLSGFGISILVKSIFPYLPTTAYLIYFYSIITAFGFLVFAYGDPKAEILPFITIINLFMPVLIIVIGFPLIYIIAPRPERMEEFPIRKYEMEKIKTNVSKVKDSFILLEKKIEQHSAQVDSSFNKIIEEVETKNNELAAIEKEVQKVKSDLQYYHSLSTLSQEQSQAIIDTMNRNKWVDYLVGLISGIISSLIVYYFSKRSTRTRFTRSL